MYGRPRRGYGSGHGVGPGDVELIERSAMASASASSQGASNGMHPALRRRPHGGDAGEASAFPGNGNAAADSGDVSTSHGSPDRGARFGKPGWRFRSQSTPRGGGNGEYGKLSDGGAALKELFNFKQLSKLVEESALVQRLKAAGSGPAGTGGRGRRRRGSPPRGSGGLAAALDPGEGREMAASTLPRTPSLPRSFSASVPSFGKKDD